jgi:Domain of unknown function (DUF4148)
MKSLLYSVVTASVLAAPAVSFAQQSNAPVTRAQARAELIQLEQAGYNPARHDPDYPANIQAAQARVAAQNGAAQGQTSGYGPSVSGSSVSGSSASDSSQSSGWADQKIIREIMVFLHGNGVSTSRAVRYR